MRSFVFHFIQFYRFTFSTSLKKALIHLFFSHQLWVNSRTLSSLGRVTNKKKRKTLNSMHAVICKKDIPYIEALSGQSITSCLGLHLAVGEVNKVGTDQWKPLPKSTHHTLFFGMDSVQLFRV